MSISRIVWVALGAVVAVVAVGALPDLAVVVVTTAPGFVPDYVVVKHPKSLSFTEAASVWMMFITAYGPLIVDAR